MRIRATKLLTLKQTPILRRGGSSSAGRAAGLVAAAALAASGCLTILGDFPDPGASASSGTAGSSAASTGDTSSSGISASGGGSTSTVGSGGAGGATGAGGVGGGAGGSQGQGGAGGAGGGAGGSQGQGGAGGSGPVTVYCKNAECKPGEICCHDMASVDPNNDHCGDPGTCGAGFGELKCDGPSDCGGDMCCAEYVNPSYKASACKPTCDPGTERILCVDNSQCMSPSMCTPSAKLGTGYSFCP